MRARRQERVPAVTVPRLTVYLRKLRELQARGVERVSSKELAGLIDLNAAQIRKDFSYFGEFGTRGVGYEVERLVDEINRCLGLERSWNVIIVGAGSLGTALARYRGFAEQGFRSSPCSTPRHKVVGVSFGDGRTIRDVADLEPSARKSASTSPSSRCRRTPPQSDHRPPRRARTGRRPGRPELRAGQVLPRATCWCARSTSPASSCSCRSTSTARADRRSRPEVQRRARRRRTCWPRRPLRRRRAAGRRRCVYAPLFAALDGPWASRSTYPLALEFVYEGYLSHYREARLLAAGRRPSTTALLAGDRFYAQRPAPGRARAATSTPWRCWRGSWRAARACAPSGGRSPTTTLCGRCTWPASPRCAGRPTRSRRRALFDEVGYGPLRGAAAWSGCPTSCGARPARSGCAARAARRRSGASRPGSRARDSASLADWPLTRPPPTPARQPSRPSRRVEPCEPARLRRACWRARASSCV